MVRKIGVAAAAAALLMTAACGGGGRPSTSEIQKSLTGGKAGAVIGETTLTDTQAKCIAKLLEDSDISDSGLKAIVDGKKDYKPSKSDAAEAAKLITKFGTCTG